MTGCPDRYMVHVPAEGVFLVVDGKVKTLDGRTMAPRDTPEGECPYTHAHTRHWCGYEGCRES